jgi:hypothetical protein
VAALVATEVMPVLTSMARFMSWMGDMGGLE